MVRKECIEVKDSKTRKKKSKTNLDYNKELYELLAEKRKAIAGKKRVPLYVIFANSVLEELAYAMPTTRDEFLDIKGIGEKKYDSYGSDFMTIIEEFQNR